MGEILLKESTTEQLLKELETRVEAIMCAYVIPDNAGGQVMHLTKGDYLHKWGLVKMLEAGMRYHDYMIGKDEYNDEPGNYFKSE